MIALTVKSIVDKYTLKTITRNAASLGAKCKTHVSPHGEHQKKASRPHITLILRFAVFSIQKTKICDRHNLQCNQTVARFKKALRAGLP